MKTLGFFSEQLADSMAQKNLTAKTLAPKVKCSYENVRGMLVGKSLPGPRLLRHLCATFGWSENRLRGFVMMDQARKKCGDSFWIMMNKNPQWEPFYILWEFLTPEERGFFADYLRFVLDRKQRTQHPSPKLISSLGEAPSEE